MSNTQTKPWSDNPNAPKIPYGVYFAEKADFIGLFLSAILYGILIVLFFQCMAALLNPANRKRDGSKWGLACYTVAMFSCVTVVTATSQNIASLSFIDNREFPGVEGLFPPGPTGYQAKTCSGASGIAPGLGALLNSLLADGLLLYRCYIIYGKNLRVVAFPCLMYLASVATGIAILVSESCGWGNVSLILPHLSISVSLNVLLTLMIVIRLVVYGRNLRAVTGSVAGIGGLYKTIATMLIESCALYAANSLLLIGLWATGSGASGIFLPTFADTQVIAPLLVIQRVANRSALTSNTIITGQADTFHCVGTRGELMGGDPSLPSLHPVGPVDNYGKNTGEFGIVVEVKVDLPRDSEA